jgi:hypothetical protein
MLPVSTAALVAVALAAIRSSFSWHTFAFGQLAWLYAAAVGAWPFLHQQAQTQLQFDSRMRDVPEYRPRWARADLESTLGKFTAEGSSNDRAVPTEGDGLIEAQMWKLRRIALRASTTTAATILVRQYYYPGWTTTRKLLALIFLCGIDLGI